MPVVSGAVSWIGRAPERILGAAAESALGSRAAIHRPADHTSVANTEVQRCYSDELARMTSALISRGAEALSFALLGHSDLGLHNMRVHIFTGPFVGLETHTDLDDLPSSLLSLVVMLSRPSEYDGGELVIDDEVHKLRQFDAAVFPSEVPHSVRPVHVGRRITWHARLASGRDAE